MLAASFPPALGVEGLERLEGLARGDCTLVLGCGGDPFAFRRAIWERLLGEAYLWGGFHLTCGLNHLLASGRRPNLRHLSWEQRYCQPLEEVVEFYRVYFAVFGAGGARVQGSIRQVLAPWVADGLVQAQGQVTLAVLWWSKPR